MKTLPEFDAWLNGLKDRTTRLRLNTRLRKATLGNLGVVKPVGENLYEMKETFGSGWRIVLHQTWRVPDSHAGGVATKNRSPAILPKPKNLKTR